MRGVLSVIPQDFQVGSLDAALEYVRVDERGLVRDGVGTSKGSVPVASQVFSEALEVSVQRSQLAGSSLRSNHLTHSSSSASGQLGLYSSSGSGNAGGQELRGCGRGEGYLALGGSGALSVVTDGSVRLGEPSRVHRRRRKGKRSPRAALLASATESHGAYDLRTLSSQASGDNGPDGFGLVDASKLDATVMRHLMSTTGYQPQLTAQLLTDSMEGRNDVAGTSSDDADGAPVRRGSNAIVLDATDFGHEFDMAHDVSDDSDDDEGDDAASAGSSDEVQEPAAVAVHAAPAAAAASASWLQVPFSVEHQSVTTDSDTPTWHIDLTKVKAMYEEVFVQGILPSVGDHMVSVTMPRAAVRRCRLVVAFQALWHCFQCVQPSILNVGHAILLFYGRVMFVADPTTLGDDVPAAAAPLACQV